MRSSVLLLGLVLFGGCTAGESASPPGGEGGGAPASDASTDGAPASGGHAADASDDASMSGHPSDAGAGSPSDASDDASSGGHGGGGDTAGAPDASSGGHPSDAGMDAAEDASMSGHAGESGASGSGGKSGTGGTGGTGGTSSTGGTSGTGGHGADGGTSSTDAGVPDASTGSTMRVGMNTGPGGTVADQSVYGGFDTQLGVSGVRLFFPVYTYAITSSSNNDDSGPYYFKDNLDQLVNRIQGYASQGFRITLTISGSTCGSTPNCPPFPATLTTKRADGSFETEFDTYMQTLIGLLGATFDQVSTVEIWNEWDGGYGYTQNGGTHTWTAAQFVPAILQGGYAAVKEHSAKIEVLAGAVLMNHESDITALVTAGATPYADGFSYHPYYNAAADLASGLAKAKAAVPQGKSLFLTEWGCQTKDINQRAAGLTASFPILRAAGVEEADYFVLFYQGADQDTFGLLNATLTGHDPTLAVTDASPRQPLFGAFQAGSL